MSTASFLPADARTAFRPLLGVAALLATVVIAPAQSERDAARAARSQGKGPLPDPALLDGSKEAAEKRPEYGMIGNFELPGQAEAQSDRVGASGEPPPASGAQGPAASAAAAASASAAAGGAAAASRPAGAGAGGVEPIQAQGAADATAEGTQASSLSDPSGGAAASQSQGRASKPGDVRIGDASMQIKTLPPGSAASVVGLEPQQKGKETPQSYDPKTPGGGKQSGGRGNQGVEKGKVMPTGL
jgi:hypothetical protein